ncbi:VOC family protein [Paenibacillus sp. LMG 31456]|uniref:VOC family protein n=1 Tax=Paenibacillus foliorum TaxID=2654974 RepID=A0A972K3B8_9BACL|nr:VOC family protein [Paenibacillus foliorum]NOU95738.1 VOC family protein [Paenibacillus foliorum]
MITAISHYGVKVKDMERSVSFYCNVLGFEESFKLYNDDGSVRIVYLHIGRHHFIELFPDGQEEYRYIPTAVGMNHLCYEVDDAYATVEQIKANGGTLEKEIETGRSGCLQFWIADPDNNRIELMQLLPDSLQAKALQAIQTKYSQ